MPRTTTDDDDDDDNDVSESILIVSGHDNELIVAVISLSSLTTVFLALIVIFGRFMNFIIGVGLGEFLITAAAAAAVSMDLLQGLLLSAVSVEGMSESSLMPSSLLLAKVSNPSTLIDLMPIIVLSSAVSRDPEMLSKPHGMTSS